MSRKNLAELCVIRKAHASDDLELGELLVDSFKKTYARLMPDVVVSEEREQELRNVEARRKVAAVLVAELDSQILGTVTLFPAESPLSLSWLVGYCDLRMMAVHESTRGTGLADRLIEACIEQARAWNSQGITLHVREGADGLQRFYHRHGFMRALDGDRDLRPQIYKMGYALKLG